MAVSRSKSFESYKDTEILTANQGKLIVMLYEGALRFLKTAIDNMDHKTYDIVNTNVLKAQDIVTELMLSLNMDEGGEISQNLFNIYAYLKKRLIEANMSKDATALQECMSLLEELKAAWDEVATKEGGRPEPVANQTRQAGASFSIQG